jgi:sortase A
MAHNFNSHFGRLPQLSVGSQIQFMDMDGQLWNYQVVAMDVLAAEAVEEMTAGEYDLTLFTCATNRTHRVTVRCNKMEGF